MRSVNGAIHKISLLVQLFKLTTKLSLRGQGKEKQDYIIKEHNYSLISSPDLTTQRAYRRGYIQEQVYKDVYKPLSVYHPVGSR